MIQLTLTVAFAITVLKPKRCGSLNKQTNTTPQLFHGWNFRYRNDISGYKQLQRFKTRTSPRATHQESKGTAQGLLRTNFSKNIFEELIQNIKSRQRERGYPENLVQKILSEMQFKKRKLYLLQKPQKSKRILPFVTQYHPAVTNLRQIVMKDWHLIERQPLLKRICKHPPVMLQKRAVNQRYTAESEITNLKG